MEVGEDRVENGIDEFAVAERIDLVTQPVAHRVPSEFGRELSKRCSDRHLDRRRLVEADVEHRIEHLLLARLPREQRAGRPARVDGPVHLAEHVVLAVLVAEPHELLGVRCGDVEGLHERLLGHLPVRLVNPGDVGLHEAVFEPPTCEVLHDDAEVLLQGRGAEIGVEEHEAAPPLDQDGNQSELFGIGLGEVPRRREMGERALEVPREAVEWASQHLGVARLVDESAAAVTAYVPEALDRVGRRAYEHERQVADLVDVGVADVRDMLLTTGELPGSPPDTLLLPLVELAAGVPLDGDVGRAQVAGRLDEQ